MTTLRIGSELVGFGQPTFVIAEIGINHNGSLNYARDLIDVAVEAGCNAVKFQRRYIPVVYRPEELWTLRAFGRGFIENAMERVQIENITHPVFPVPGQYERLSAWLEGKPVETYNTDLKYALEFGSKEWDLIRLHCEKRGICWGVSSWDGISVYAIDGFQVAFHKVASPCLTHADLLRRIRRCGKPVILSTGGSTMDQIEEAVKILGTENLVILHCTSTYPSKDEEANLQVIHTLKHWFPGVPIGYSGHEKDTLATRVAVALGASVVERHITLDRRLDGSDQKASIEPHELEELVRAIRTIETLRGTRTDVSTERLVEGAEERINTLLGSPKKQVLDGEIPVMEKLRRVTDF